MRFFHAEPVLDTQSDVAESPFWYSAEKCLYWVDIEKRQLNKFDPVNGINISTVLDRRVGCVVPTNEQSFLLAGEGGIEEYWPETEEWAFLVNPEPDKPNNRLNDGKCSPEGRFWFGSLNMKKESNQASLYVMDSQGKVRQILAGLTNSNGIAWSPSGSVFYHIDTPTRQVSAFDYDHELGTLRNRRVVVQFPDDPDFGRPDGMTVDAEGLLWIAHWQGHRVTRWNPVTSAMVAVVDIPATQVTSVAFGGENLNTLYITTARFGLDAEQLKVQPYAGSIFSVSPDTIGLPTNYFRWDDT